MIDLRIKILDDMSNLYPFYNYWDPKHDGDSGLDLFVPNDIEVKCGETVFIDLKIKCEMLNDENK